VNVTIQLTLTLEIEIDGRDPGEAWIKDQAKSAIQEAVPHVLIDSDEEDCILFVRSSEIKEV